MRCQFNRNRQTQSDPLPQWCARRNEAILHVNDLLGSPWLVWKLRRNWILVRTFVIWWHKRVMWFRMPLVWSTVPDFEVVWYNRNEIHTITEIEPIIETRQDKKHNILSGSIWFFNVAPNSHRCVVYSVGRDRDDKNSNDRFWWKSRNYRLICAKSTRDCSFSECIHRRTVVLPSHLGRSKFHRGSNVQVILVVLLLQLKDDGGRSSIVILPFLPHLWGACFTISPTSTAAHLNCWEFQNYSLRRACNGRNIVVWMRRCLASSSRTPRYRSMTRESSRVGPPCYVVSWNYPSFI
jgi:hypothetical protein